ncbi:MAG: beta-lactamase family protein [Acidimicrobiia bacterium]|nr:beta-lactamase family protein [Acidimicrobiia bacterium]
MAPSSPPRTTNDSRTVGTTRAVHSISAVPACAALGALVFTAACGLVGSPGADEQVWPSDTWSTTDPGDAGLDPAAIAALVTQAAAAESRCLVVTANGHVVAEGTWGDEGPDDPSNTFSVTKSITSLLVGIASDRGLLDVDDPVATHVEDWVDPPGEPIRVRHLLSNTSGLPDGGDDFSIFVEEATEDATDLAPLHDPDEVWEYNNAAVQVLDAVLVAATGQPTREFAEEALFAPLGMHHTEMVTDGVGDTMTFTGATSTCRDLARLGLLLLADGEWDGTQVVSSEWVRRATFPSQDLNPAYGHLWWLNRPGGIALEDVGGHGDELAPDVDREMVAGVGLGGQVVAVFPEDGIVVTRMSTADDAPPFSARDIAEGIDAALAPTPGGEGAAGTSAATHRSHG